LQPPTPHWPLIVKAAHHLRASHDVALTPELSGAVLAELDAKGRLSLELALADLPLADRLPLQSILEELQWMGWAHTASALLATAAPQVAADAVAAQARLLNQRREEFGGLEPCLLAFLGGWSEALRFPEAESAYRLAGLWMLDLCTAVEADFHEWRALFESMQMALTAHLPQETSFGLVRQLRRLLEMVPRFEFVASLCKGALSAPAVEGIDGGPIVLMCAAELIAPPPEPKCASPLLSALLRSRLAPALTSKSFGPLAQALIAYYRPAFERSWLDNLEDLLGRAMAVLEWREGRARERSTWSQTCGATVATLAEVLDAYQTSPSAAEDLAEIFESAFEARLVTRDLAQARALFRPWFLGRYAVGEGVALFTQPRAVLKAMATQMAQMVRDDRGRALSCLEQGLGIADTIPSLLESALPLRKAPDAAEQSWLLARSLLAYEESAWMECMQQTLPLRGIAPVLGWLEDGEGWLEQLDPSGAMSQLWQRRGVPRRRLQLAGTLWDMGPRIADQAAPLVYQRVPEYAQQSRPESAEKCQRDFTALLRRVAWALLYPGDSVDQVADWWSEFVESYLVNRHRDLYSNAYSAIMESAAEHLDAALLELLEPHIKAVLPPAETSPSELEQSTFALLEFAYPLQDRLPAEVLAQRPGWPPLSEQEAGENAEFWNASLAKAWPTYLWTGYLSPENTRRWSLWLTAHPQHRGLVEGLLRGRAQALAPQHALSVDYLQAALDFLRQHRLGVALQGESSALAAQLGASLPEPEQARHCDLGGWLAQLGRCWSELAPPLAAVEFRRYLLLEVAPRQAFDAKLWERIWTTLGTLDTLRPEARQLAHRGEILLRLGLFTKNFATSSDPVFSPEPEEELQWRQLLSGLAALGLYSEIDDCQQRHLLVSLAQSCPITRDPDFVDKLAQVSQAFEHAPDAAIATLTHALTVRAQLEAAVSQPWPELETIRQNGLRKSWEGSTWGLPCLARPSAEAVAGSVAVPARNGTSTGQDMTWLERRLDVDARYLGLTSSAAFSWYCHTSELLAEPSKASAQLQSLAALWASRGRQDGEPAHETARDRFWGPAVFALRDVIDGRPELSFFRPDASLPVGVEGPSRAWPQLVSVDMAAAYQEACAADGQPAEEDGIFDLVAAERLLALLVEEYPEFERSGLCGPRLGRVSHGWSTARMERYLKVLIGQLSKSGAEQGLLDRLRVIDYLQANLEWVRQIDLARQLQAKREALLDLLDLPSEERAAAARSLSALADLLSLAPRPTASLSHLCYQLESAARVDPRPLLSEQAWRELGRRAAEVLPAGSAREISWWCEQGEQHAARLAETARFLRDSGTAELSLEWRRLVNSALALRLLAETQPSWLGALRWRVAEQFSGLQGGELEARIERLRVVVNGIRDGFIELDLRPLLTEFEMLEKGWRLLAGWNCLWQERDSVLATLAGKVPEVAALVPEWLLRLSYGLIWSELAGDRNGASRWRLSPILRGLPHQALGELGRLPSGASLQAALFNLVGRYVALSEDSELGRTLQYARSLPELEAAWSQSLDVSSGGKPAGAVWQRDLTSLARRLAVDGWQGQDQPPEGSLEWCRWEMAPQASNGTLRQFRQAIDGTVAAMLKSGAFSEPIKRCATDFERSCEQRFAQADKKADLWALLGAPVVAGKPEKRRWWDKISESFEGIVSVVKAN
jgi:hypothetical protein